MTSTEFLQHTLVMCACTFAGACNDVYCCVLGRGSKRVSLMTRRHTQPDDAGLYECRSHNDVMNKDMVRVSMQPSQGLPDTIYVFQISQDILHPRVHECKYMCTCIYSVSHAYQGYGDHYSTSSLLICQQMALQSSIH